MSISGSYDILVSEYAKKHFIKSFQKKYKVAWDQTFDTINDMLCRIDNFLLSSKAEKIHICDKWYIAKCEFKIAWSNESAKTSGNRIIIYVDEMKYEVQILLIYCKTDISWNNETAWRWSEIKQNHKDVAKLFIWL